MTEQEYQKLLKEGQNLLSLIALNLNELQTFSFEGATQNNEPNYRTEASWKEICVALALLERKRECHKISPNSMPSFWSM